MLRNNTNYAKYCVVPTEQDRNMHVASSYDCFGARAAQVTSQMRIYLQETKQLNE